MRKDNGTRRHKTIRDNIAPPNACKGDVVKIVGGAFAGWAGKVVDIDGIWLTVETVRSESDEHGTTPQAAMALLRSLPNV